MESRYLVQSIRLLALVASVTFADAQFCLFNGYDFSQEFTGQTISAMETYNGYTAEVTPCGRPLNPTACNSTLTPMDTANKVAGDWCYGVLAKLDLSGQWEYVNGVNFFDGVMVSYQNGDLCFSGEPVAFDLIFKCAETTPEPSFVFLDGFDQCQAQFTVPSKLACSPPGTKMAVKSD